MRIIRVKNPQKSYFIKIMGLQLKHKEHLEGMAKAKLLQASICFLQSAKEKG